jgi:hypothetical protein
VAAMLERGILTEDQALDDSAIAAAAGRILTQWADANFTATRGAFSPETSRM